MSDLTMICPVCEEGNLVVSTYSYEFKYNNDTINIDDLECYLCDSCGSDPVYPDQIKRNQILIADAKRQSENLLIGKK